MKSFNISYVSKNQFIKQDIESPNIEKAIQYGLSKTFRKKNKKE